MAQKKNTNVFLFRCYRGWDNYQLYLKQPFTTIFIKPSDFYINSRLYQHLIEKYKINVCHFDSAEAVSFQADLVGKRCLKVWEVLNVNHTLITRLGGSKKKIEKAIKYERIAGEKSDLILARSKKDKQDLVEIGIDRKKIVLYRGCITPENYQFENNRTNKKLVLFLGNMFYKPNEEAVNIIRERIIPPVVKNLPQAEFVFVGNYPKYLSQKMKKFGEKVKFTGGVVDINPILSQTRIALAPLTSGSGTRLKILVYLSAGIPTIATGLAIEGLKETIRNHLIIEDNLDKYPQLITRLFSRSIPKKKLVKARQWVERNYSWKNEADKIINHYIKSLAKIHCGPEEKNRN